MQVVKSQVQSEIDVLLTNKIHKGNQQKSLRRWGFSFVIILLTVYLLTAVVFEIEIIHGSSMNNTFTDGQLAVSYRLSKSYDYSDVVILKNISDNDYIKRIIGLPGDTVDLNAETGAVVLNGAVLDESYALGKTMSTDENMEYPVHLGENEYFVLGDNREHSSDSRFFGAIKREQIKGKVILPQN